MLKFPKNKLSGLKISQINEEEFVVAESRVNGGMVTSIDSADIENNQFRDLKNIAVRYDVTSRRVGSTVFTPAKPNSNKILELASFERYSGDVFLMRMTPSTVHAGSSSSWTAITGVLSGGPYDRFQTLVINDRFIFANNGADKIQEVNIGAATFAQLGDAPSYKYITSFNNRILGANLADPVAPSPIKLGWCGNLNFSEWDPSVDQSAGFMSLIDSPTDFSDDITGLFGLTDVALILRQRSLWALSKQPVATNPFILNVVSSGFGCDSPYSATVVHNGICWFDFRTGTVYYYEVGTQAPIAIGRPVENTLQGQIDDVERIFASYNSINDEYILAIPSSLSNTVTLWTFNFRTKAWSYDELDNISSINNINYNSGAIVIDELGGMIDDLVGNIDDLTINVAVPSRFYGKSDGNILIEDPASLNDGGSNYTTRIISKTFVLPRNQQVINTLRVEYRPIAEGSFTISYSKDGGVTWTAYKTVSWTGAESRLRKLVTCRKHIRCDQFNWKIESTAGTFDILEYEITQHRSDAESQTR